jgi:hypothetical protein
MKMRVGIGAGVVVAVGACALAQDGLIVASSNFSDPVFVRRAGAWAPLFAGSGAWALAADDANCTLYFVNDGGIAGGGMLWRFRRGDLDPAPVTTLTYQSEPINFQGLGYYNGTLVGSRNFSLEGFYSIDITSGVCTLLWANPSAFDFGGIDFDPQSGLLYATDDATGTANAPGLYRISLTPGSATRIASYPDSALFPGSGNGTDVDGLAIGGGKAWLVVDEPGVIPGFNLGAAGYDQFLTGPFLGVGTFSGAAWAPCFNEPACGSADFNGDGDVGTDSDIEAFFACLAGSCCAECGSADFNADGDVGTDADIEAFFRVLSGGTC